MVVVEAFDEKIVIVYKLFDEPEVSQVISRNFTRRVDMKHTKALTKLAARCPKREFGFCLEHWEIL